MAACIRRKKDVTREGLQTGVAITRVGQETEADFEPILVSFDRTFVELMRVVAVRLVGSIIRALELASQSLHRCTRRPMRKITLFSHNRLRKDVGSAVGGANLRDEIVQYF